MYARQGIHHCAVRHNITLHHRCNTSLPKATSLARMGKHHCAAGTTSLRQRRNITGSPSGIAPATAGERVYITLHRRCKTSLARMGKHHCAAGTTSLHQRRNITFCYYRLCGIIYYFDCPLRFYRMTQALP